MKKVIFLGVFFLFFSCENTQKLAYKLFLEEDLLKRPKSKRCADCHQNIYNQWKNSRHSVSWVSDDFKKSSNRYSKIKCLSCHAPLEIEPLKEPKLRDFHREEGINCVSCHFKEKTNSMHGPYEVFSPPHYSTKDPNYTKSKICAGCHRETYKQWKTANTQKNCQNCHMPSKKDNLIQKFPFYLLHKKKEVHNHSSPPLIASKEDIKLKIKVLKDEIKVLIKNTGIPHKLPTADQGKPKLYIKAEFFLNGEKVDEDSNMITHKQGIEYNKEKEFTFYSFENFDLVKISVSRKLSWKKKAEPITSISLDIEK
ncbi:MAG: hypothetical protein GXO22_07185 [Aquificae bacterium]|nr:hypothetical protein [Aquificota bacterium]